MTYAELYNYFTINGISSKQDAETVKTMRSIELLRKQLTK
jgi:hypothetical protein